MYSRAFDEASPLQVPGNYAGTAFEREPPPEDTPKEEAPRKEPCEEAFAPMGEPPKKREEKRRDGDWDMLLLLQG